MRAIEMTAKWLVEKNISSKKIDFYVDNQASLQSVSALSCTLNTANEARKSLISLGLKNTVKLTWVQSHKGTEGNEVADKAARDATNCEIFGPNIPLAMASAKHTIKLNLRKEWTKEWCNIKGHRQSKYFLSGPDQKFKMTTKYSRDNISALIRSITGHSFMKRHQNQVINNDTDITCRLCLEEDETPHHIITECPVLLHRR